MYKNLTKILSLSMAAALGCSALESHARKELKYEMSLKSGKYEIQVPCSMKLQDQLKKDQPIVMRPYLFKPMLIEIDEQGKSSFFDIQKDGSYTQSSEKPKSFFLVNYEPIK